MENLNHLGKKYKSVYQDHPGSEVGIWKPQEEKNWLNTKDIKAHWDEIY